MKFCDLLEKRRVVDDIENWSEAHLRCRQESEIHKENFSLFVCARDNLRKFANRTKNDDVGVVRVGWTNETRGKNILVFLGERVEDWSGNLGRFTDLLKRSGKKPGSLRRRKDDVSGEESGDHQQGGRSANLSRKNYPRVIQAGGNYSDYAGEEKEEIPLEEVMPARQGNSVRCGCRQ